MFKTFCRVNLVSIEESLQRLRIRLENVKTRTSSQPSVLSGTPLASLTTK